MEDKRITLCCVSKNAKYSLALMLESYRKFNSDFPAAVIIIDNGSTDGALEYARQHADMLLLSDNGKNHGTYLTDMIRLVDTQFCITIDNDVSFTAPGGVQFMMDHLDDKAYCVCPDRYGHPKGEPFGGDGTNAYSPNICCGLFRTEVIQYLCQEFTLGYYINYQGRFAYETGGLIWRIAKLFGMDSVELPELWRYCFHHGQISTLFNFVPNYPSEEGMKSAYKEDEKTWNWILTLAERYQRVMRDLAAVRGTSVDRLSVTDPAPTNSPVEQDLTTVHAAATHPFMSDYLTHALKSPWDWRRGRE